MYRGTIHRGIAVLSLVTFLAVAGAQPAAAAPDAGFLGRLAGLWSEVVAGESDTLWNRLAGWLEGKPAAKTSIIIDPNLPKPRGGGIDPNGNDVRVEGEGTDGGN